MSRSVKSVKKYTKHQATHLEKVHNVQKCVPAVSTLYI